MHGKPRALALALCVLTVGCTSIAHPRIPHLGLQRQLFPGLGDLDQNGIDAALLTPLTLEPPVAGGLVWLSEALPGSPEAGSGTPISEYARTGVLDETVAALRQAPFGTVAALPTLPKLSGEAPAGNTLDALRSASARFQYDVALLLQTGTAEDSGYNPLALGYLGLVTAPLFPGSDIAASSSAELCAIDVRSGVMLGCARGRAREMDRFLFPWQKDDARERLVERTLRASVADAARDLLGQLAARIASG